MPPPAALSAEKRSAILDSARQAFGEHGYEGASMSAITRAAGVSKATVYHHFHSKAALFGAFVERECGQMLQQFFGDTEMPRGGTAQTLRAIGAGMLDLLTSQVCLMIDRVVTAEAEAFPELAQAFYAAGPQQGISRLAGWLRTETDAGRLAVVDPEFAAEQFFTLVQTRIVLRSRLRLGVPAEGAERVVDATVAMFLNTYAANPAGAPRQRASRRR